MLSTEEARPSELSFVVSMSLLISLAYMHAIAHTGLELVGVFFLLRDHHETFEST